MLWNFYDDYGVLQRVQVKSYYIPTSNVRLFSPQSYFRQENGGSFILNTKDCVFTFVTGENLAFEYSLCSKIPIAKAVIKPELIPRSFYNTTDWKGVSAGKLNISKTQEKLLLWYGIVGHHDMAATQSMMTVR